MTITDTDFRALARSSPWLWRSLELVWNEGSRVWLSRPARCVWQDLDGLRRVAESPSDGRSVFGWSDDGSPLTGEAATRAFGNFRFFDEVDVERRTDGLVAGRPTDPLLAGPSQPMVDGYFSVAAVDPVELAEQVELSDVRTETWRKRETWVARCRPMAEYEPRCGCCALLPDLRLAELEWGEERAADMTFPDDVEIWLDRQTGVMVRWLPNGGPRVPVEVEIVAVDDLAGFESAWSRASSQ